MYYLHGNRIFSCAYSLISWILWRRRRYRRRLFVLIIASCAVPTKYALVTVLLPTVSVVLACRSWWLLGMFASVGTAEGWTWKNFRYADAKDMGLFYLDVLQHIQSPSKLVIKL